MNIQTWQTIGSVVAAFAALLGGIYAVVTRPLLISQQAMQAQLNDIVQRLGRIEKQLTVENVALRRCRC